MKTIKEGLDTGIAYLEGKGISSPRRQTEEILSAVLEIPRLQLYLEFDRPIELQEWDLYRGYLKRRGDREPLAYIFPKVEFYKCTFVLSPHVLIPRQETELLVDLIVKRLQGTVLRGKVLWDLCCGSGCIGIALKKALPELTVFGSDLSMNALNIARQNALLNGAEVTFFQGDLLEPFRGQQADFVVSNPPYVSQSEWEGLEKEVKGYEPLEALVSGPTGFEVYKRLANELPGYAKRLFLEIGASQGERVKEIFSMQPWGSPELLQDWAGLDRFLFVSV